MVAKTRGTKRAAQGEGEAAPAKKKLTQQEQMMEGVSSALGGSENMTPETKDMLVAMVNGSLGTAKDERHPYQASVVAMIGKALDSIQSDMKTAVGAENEKIASLEASKTGLQAAKVKASELFEEAVKKSKHKKTLLAESSVALSKAKQALKELQEAQIKGDASHTAAMKETAKHETAIADHFLPLKAGTWDSDEEAKHHLSILKPIVAKMDMEESLLTSLPTACLKPTSERGPFDNMVFDELEKILNSRLEELKSKVAAGEPEAKERQKHVDAAEAGVQDAKAGVQASAADMNAAQAEESELEAALKAAEKELEAFAPNYKKASHKRDKLVEEMEGFEAWPLECFNTLKERIVPAKQEAPAVQEATMEQETAVEAAA
eukprot:gnl/TRDRNA2_/TRDRNA2_175617_c0_seq1.p1 gnl/TRDRNA2_/TRDRNA2_175617_c0~~gnl/TRDRNA2_/TRDRNA2_175617_c0_seq1.p1  ORF type:complete len:378 (+),score=142.47 gnl/TRDRNA2_/TRDRNA2_175617_c0_seq1:91-1224(+)